MTSIREADELLDQRALALGRMSYEEKAIATIMVLTLAGWIVGGEQFGLANIALAAVVVLFVLELAQWREVEEYVNWGIILMYGGAIALGAAVAKTGAAQWVSQQTISVWADGPTMVVAIISGVSIVLTELMSNSAVVALLMPVTLGVATDFGMDPRDHGARGRGAGGPRVHAADRHARQRHRVLVGVSPHARHDDPGRDSRRQLVGGLQPRRPLLLAADRHSHRRDAMSDVLLLVPPDRQVTSAISTALDLAAGRGAGLIAAVVIDVDATERLSSRMIDVGLLAEKVTDQFSETLTREHHVRSEALLADIAAQAAARGIACRTLHEHGDPGEVCRRLVEEARVAVAVISVERRSWVARLLARGEPVRAPVLGGCEIVLVEED